MKVTVTGGAGFIGSRLVQALTRVGYEVVCLDLVSSPDTNGRTASTVDVCNFEQVRQALAGSAAVYHLAGSVLDGCQRDPRDGFLVNVVGTANLLEASKVNGVSRFLLASSFRVYEGWPVVETVDEDTPLRTSAMGVFALSKYTAECLTHEYARRVGLKATVLRFGSAFGRGRCSNVIGDFLSAAAEGRSVEVWGKGARLNQYTYVEDIAEGCVAALDCIEPVLNLVSPELTSTRQLVELLQDRVTLSVSFASTRPEGTSMAYISPTRAQTVLGWRPRPLALAIDEILDDTTPEVPLRQTTELAT